MIQLCWNSMVRESKEGGPHFKWHPKFPQYNRRMYSMRFNSKQLLHCLTVKPRANLTQWWRLAWETCSSAKENFTEPVEFSLPVDGGWRHLIIRRERRELKNGLHFSIQSQCLNEQNPWAVFFPPQTWWEKCSGLFVETQDFYENSFCMEIFCNTF